MAEMREKLDALLKKNGLMTGSQWVRQREVIQEKRQAGDFDIQHVVPGEATGDEDQFYLLRSQYPLTHLHGNVTLGSALECVSSLIALSAADADLEDFNPRTTLFMDTETIGLAGGTGTVAFLVGVGYFVGDVFRLDQCFMRDYDEEEPMLRYLADIFEGRETIVGYNSKSFDLPLMRTRFIQNRIPFRLDGFLHYDLVHAARRLWKERLRDCSLGNVERHILGLHRQGDVPSYLIPQYWFDYLRTRDARPLKGVFYHHQMDILSLAALSGLMSQLLDAPVGDGFDHTEDRLSLVRLHYRQKRYEDVYTHGRRFLEVEERGELRRECLELLARACKRLGQFDEMTSTFELLVQEFPSHIEARIELAKHFEHRQRDLVRAEAVCAEALEFLQRQSNGTSSLIGNVPALESRLARIRRKCTGNPQGSTDEFC
ncbi:MAG: ribonuclease H-like domain-containing protein [Candidatus Hydrogenedentes bacterium]|nr:ribonuclease H-like domain-containing protein [Candidatus Hydrogenedentota bacterium]